jgi:hypothetical protein
MVTVRLTRGDAGGWQAYKSTESGGITVLIHCPFCNGINSLSGNVVAEDGLVRRPVCCMYTGCLLTPYQLFLEGWKWSAFSQPVLHCPVSALCQADGAGC